VERAIKEKKITRGGGIQDQLNKVIALDEFRKALQLVLKPRGLREADVQHCLSTLYPALSKYAHGNDGHIVLRGLYHPANERAGLVALMRVQGRWKNPQRWSEVTEEAHPYSRAGETSKRSPSLTPPATTHLQTTGHPTSPKALDSRAKTSQRAK